MRGAKSWYQRPPHARWNPRFSRNHPSLRSSGKDHRLLAGYDRLEFVALFVPRLRDVPAQPVIQREMGRHPPAILKIRAQVVQPGDEVQLGTLRVTAGGTDQKTDPIAPGLEPCAEAETSTAAIVAVNDDLVVVGLHAEFHGVGTAHPGEVI
jgi:hypothetical protein